MKHLIIDAGTTNARVTLIDEAGKVLGCERRDAGVRNTAIDGHNGRLKDALRESVGVLLAKNGLSHGDIGVCVAYGMITSNVGLLEIPHCAAPADARTLRDALVRRVFPEIAPFAIDFIPGVRNFSGPVTPENAAKMDMMRGEETASSSSPDIAVMHPRISPDRPMAMNLLCEPGSTSVQRHPGFKR